MRERILSAMVTEWHNEEGWGVLTAREIEADGIWVHFSAIVMDGYKTLTPGQSVDVNVEGPLPFEQDGYRFRAKSLRPRP